MKPLKVVLIILLGLSVTFAQNKNQTKEKSPSKVKAQSSVTLKTQGDSVSYAIGQNIYSQLKDLGLNIDLLTKSIKDGSVNKSDLTQENIIKVLTAFQTRMQEKQTAQMKEQEEKRKAEIARLIEKNKKEGEAFLEENKKKEGIKTTASGLQYKVLAAGPGIGPTPKDTSNVKVHYKGTLLDGKEFDNSYKRNQPSEFPLNQVIKGWTEGLQLMHVGDKFQFFIPYQLAYGEEGRGETIPPASVLIFEVELLDIIK